MKALMSMLSLAAAAILWSGCGGGTSPEGASKPTISDAELGLRKGDVFSEEKVVADKTEYATTAPGTGVKYARSFENAPPMIPHDVTDFLPITKEYNACIGCHMPDVAPSMGATAVPKSHLVNLRPEHKMVKGTFKKSADNMKNEVVVKDLHGELYQGRYNCSQCHAPQSTGQLVENKFQADFRDESSKGSSNLLDSLNEGVH